MSTEPRFVATPVKVTRAYEELASIIRDRILSGELREGDRLPSETAMATQASVSRSTVREALRVLQEAGFIERSSPKVMVVRRHSDEPAYRELQRALRRRNVTFRDLHEALLLIEPQLAKLAAIRADPADIRELSDNVDAQVRCTDDFDQFNQLDEDFHMAIAEISGNPALIIARAPISQILLPTLHQLMVSRRMTEYAIGFHRRMLGEIQAGDPEGAALMTRKHVDDFRKGWEKAGHDYHSELGEISEGPNGGLGG